MSDRVRSRSVLGWSLCFGYGAAAIACWKIYGYLDYPIVCILIFPIIGSVMTLLSSAIILLTGYCLQHLRVLRLRLTRAPRKMSRPSRTPIGSLR